MTDTNQRNSQAGCKRQVKYVIEHRNNADHVVTPIHPNMSDNRGQKQNRAEY